jgi:mannosyltransferase
MKNTERKYLYGILGLGLLLRVLLLNSRSIQYDDAFSILLSERSLGEIVSGTAADTMPPLYYFLLHFWMMVSGNIWWLRLLSVGLNMGSIVLLYSLVSNLLGTRSALWAVFLAAISPIQIYHAQDLRMYALLAFCQMAYLWFFATIWMIHSSGKEISRWFWAGLAVSGALAMYCHNLAGFILIAPNIFLLVKRKWRLLLPLCIAQAAIALLAAPWLLMVPGQIEKIQGAFWTPRPGLVEVLQALVLFTASLPLPGVWFVIALVLSLYILVIVSLELVRVKGKRENVLFLIVMGLTPPVLLFVLSYLMRPVFVPRGFLIFGFMYAGLAGHVIAQGWKKKIGMFIMGSFVAASLISLPYQQTFRQFPRSPFAEAVAMLETEMQPGDRLIHDNKLSSFPFLVYAPDIEQEFIADEAGSHNDTLANASQEAMQLFPSADVAQAAEGADRVYFVVFAQAIAEYEEMQGTDHPQLAWLGEHYRQTDVTVFNDLEVYRFEN